MLLPRVSVNRQFFGPKPSFRTKRLSFRPNTRVLAIFRSQSPKSHPKGRFSALSIFKRHFSLFVWLSLLLHVFCFRNVITLHSCKLSVAQSHHSTVTTFLDFSHSIQFSFLISPFGRARSSRIQYHHDYHQLLYFLLLNNIPETSTYHTINIL